MNRIRGASRIYYRDHQTFLAGKFRKIFRYERCDLSILRDYVLVMRNASTDIGREIVIIVRLRCTYAGCRYGTCLVA